MSLSADLCTSVSAGKNELGDIFVAFFFRFVKRWKCNRRTDGDISHTVTHSPSIKTKKTHTAAVSSIYLFIIFYLCPCLSTIT